MILLLLLFIFTNSLSHQCGRNESTDIHVIGFFPCTDKNDTRKVPADNCDGIDRIPIMELALEEINGMCDLLPGYRLVVDYANSAVSHISIAITGIGDYKRRPGGAMAFPAEK